MARITDNTDGVKEIEVLVIVVSTLSLTTLTKIVIFLVQQYVGKRFEFLTF